MLKSPKKQPTLQTDSLSPRIVAQKQLPEHVFAEKWGPDFAIPGLGFGMGDDWLLDAFAADKPFNPETMPDSISWGDDGGFNLDDIMQLPDDDVPNLEMATMAEPVAIPEGLNPTLTQAPIRYDRLNLEPENDFLRENPFSEYAGPFDQEMSMLSESAHWLDWVQGGDFMWGYPNPNLGVALQAEEWVAGDQPSHTDLALAPSLAVEPCAMEPFATKPKSVQAVVEDPLAAVWPTQVATFSEEAKRLKRESSAVASQDKITGPAQVPTVQPALPRRSPRFKKA